jgi:hypothetical protein
MPFRLPARVGKAAIAFSIAMLLAAMLLPVCHLHPLLDKGAPDHCTICLSLHAAAPLGMHMPAAVTSTQAGMVFLIVVPTLRGRTAHFVPTRAPPLGSC